MYTNQAACNGLFWSIQQYHYPYYFLFVQFFHNQISDPYFICLNLQFLLPLVLS